MSEQKTVMAIGGHVGDMELTAGATLATMALEGYKVVTVALTAGERGNPPHLTDEAYRIQKVEEAQKFAKDLKGEAIVFEYRDGELPDDETVRYEVCDLIRKYKPEVLITHWKNSMHKDHERTHYIVKEAHFLAGLKALKREYPSHYARGPYYAENWEDATDFLPYVFTTISEKGYELWFEAINHHWFALNSTSFKYKDYYAHLKRVRGCEARTIYAEAFEIESHQKRVIKQSL